MRWPLTVVAVEGDSMAPAMWPGDFLLVSRAGRVRVGDAVMLRRPDHPGLLLVKRVRSRDPEGWWVEGDNHTRSDDSRLFGIVPDACILGRVVLRYWPPHRVGPV